jgi:enoyl-CoA hydratase/carnithine racemase
MSTSPDITVERQGPVAFMRINRPQVANAVGPAAMQALCAALDTAIADDGVKAIVLGHTGKHFMAGADLAFLESLKKASGEAVRSDIYQHFQGAAKRLHLCPKPTIAAIGGAAITVGCELALACDFRLVTCAAVFQESWIRLGLIPPLGGLKVLPALVGLGVARDMVLRARAINGQEAVALGLATELVEPDALEARALELACELAAMAPLAYRSAKEGLRRGADGSLDESWATNLLAQSLLIGSADFREGVTAVQERRAPVFTGR